MEFLHNDKETFSQAINLVTNKNSIRPEIVEKELLILTIKCVILVLGNTDYKREIS